MNQLNLFSKKNNTYTNTLRSEVQRTLSSSTSNEPDVMTNYILNNYIDTKSPQK